MELDALDAKAAEAVPRYIVRKDSIKSSRVSVPFQSLNPILFVASSAAWEPRADNRLILDEITARCYSTVSRLAHSSFNSTFC